MMPFFIDDYALSPKLRLAVRTLIRKIKKSIEKVLKRLLILVRALLLGWSHFAAAIALPRRTAPFSTLFDDLRCRNIHDRRLHLLYNGGKGARQLHGIGNRQRRTTHCCQRMRRADMAGDHRAN